MEKNENQTQLPRIFFEGGSWLVWTVNDVEYLLKNANIFGSASMTAPHFPSQSGELSLPVELMPCEARWCHENHFGSLFVIKPKIELTTIPIPQLPQNFNNPIQIDNESEYEIVPIDPPKIDSLIYQTYCILKDKKFWILDGKNYGCEFSIYKEEPWKCHSFALVWCENQFFNTRNLIQHVRISESTKKRAIASVFANDGSIKFLDFTRYKTKGDPEEEILNEEGDDDIL